MNLTQIARIAGLCLIVLVAAMTVSADYPADCDCSSCANAQPYQTCSTRTPMEVTVWSCDQWLAQNCGTTCETVTDCQSNADCFGGTCTRPGICLCPGT